MARRYSLLALACGCLLTAGACAAEPPSGWGNWTRWGDLGNGRYQNPVLPADYSDLDVIRKGDDYYAITSTFQFSPGVAILHSRDLVNWTTVGHAVPDLTRISPELNWDRMNRYGRGVWAGAIRYHAGRFWIYFGTPEEGYFMTSAEKPEGPWTPLHHMLKAAGWDDCSPFWDDDGKGYFVGTNFSDGYKIHMWEMSADNRELMPETDQVIYQFKGSEANKLYKFNGSYYHFFSEVHGNTRVMMMRRAASLRGPWSGKRQLMQADLAARQPNQGGIVTGPDGKWYFFTHHGDGDWAGRQASLLPVHWIDGWPVIGEPDAQGVGTMVWNGKLPRGGEPLSFPQGGLDGFDTAKLAPVWEWNYQPRAGKWSLAARPGFLRLHAFAGLDGGNLLKVGNVLTQRAVRSGSQAFVASFELKGMADGQHAGIAHFTAHPKGPRATSSASVGVVMQNGRRYLELSRDGTYTRLHAWPHGAIWLKSSWGLDGKSSWSVSADGKAFEPVGDAFEFSWGAYRGDRVGLFTFNPLGEQGHVDVDAVSYTIGRRAAETGKEEAARLLERLP